MREIKFRGYNGGDWIYSECIYYNEFPTLSDRLIHMPNYEDDNCNTLDVETWDTVWNLGQYINLKDINDKEIYEGDIVSVSKDNKQIAIGEIKYGKFKYSKCDEYNCEHTGYYVSCPHTNYCKNTGVSLDEEYLKYEVVGNIFENKDLLEVI